MRAHKEFARLNEATRDRWAGRGIHIDIEPYVNVGGYKTWRGANRSLSVDAVIQYRGTNVRGFDLKTGRLWSRSELYERIRRLRIPIQQIIP